MDILKYIDTRYLVYIYISLNIFTTDKEFAFDNISNNHKNNKVKYFPTLKERKNSLKVCHCIIKLNIPLRSNLLNALFVFKSANALVVLRNNNINKYT